MMRNLVELTCVEVVELATDFQTGLLSVGDRARFEQHLHTCPACLTYVDQVVKTVELTGKVHEEALPEEPKRALLGAFRAWRKGAEATSGAAPPVEREVESAPPSSSPSTGPETAYKFLAAGAIGPMSRHRWPVPTGGAPGAWVEAKRPLAVCSTGVHLCRPGDLAHWLHDELWVAELDGERIAGVDCVVAERARLLRRVEAWQEGGAERFAAACAEHAAELAAHAPPDAVERARPYLADARNYLDLRMFAVSAFCAAVAVAKLGAATEQEAAYQRERAWQSAFLMRDLDLV
jgi:hypothetical protein